MGAGLLTGIQARVQRPEYARLLSDCQTLYCDTRLQLVSGVTHDAILHMSSEPLPVLARDGWAYLMQVCCNFPAMLRFLHLKAFSLSNSKLLQVIQIETCCLDCHRRLCAVRSLKSTAAQTLAIFKLLCWLNCFSHLAPSFVMCIV